MGLNMLKLEAAMRVPQRPQRYSPQLEFLFVKPLYHMMCKHEEILDQGTALLQLTPNQSPDVTGKQALPQNMLCCFILLVAKEALRVNLHFPPGKVGFCRCQRYIVQVGLGLGLLHWSNICLIYISNSSYNIAASSPHKCSNLQRDVQGP